MSDPTTEATVDGKEGPKGFLDDPFNMAMYVVLPCMIVVYGGCSVIYCVHRLQRYCRKQARKKQRLLNNKDDDDTANNDGTDDERGQINQALKGDISVIDLDSAATTTTTTTTTTASRKALLVKSNQRTTGAKTPVAAANTSREGTKTPASIASSGTLPSRAGSRTPGSRAPGSRTPGAANGRGPKKGPSRPVMMEAGCQTEEMPDEFPSLADWVQASRPSYKSGQAEFRQQMQHLDDQLKAAFRLINEENPKPEGEGEGEGGGGEEGSAGKQKPQIRSWPDEARKEGENKKPLPKRSQSKLRFFVSQS